MIVLPWGVLDERLREMHSSMSYEEIGKTLGKSTNAVRNRCWRLRLRKKSLGWTTEDKEIVRRAYEAAGDGPVRINALCTSLGRKKASVSEMAGSMGLTTRFRKRPEECLVEYSRRAASAITRHGHPRGMLGKTHSVEMRNAVSARMRKYAAAGTHPWQRPATQETRQQMAERNVRRMKAGASQMYSRCKHGRRPDLDDQFFRSAWEANYARFLNLLKAQGQIEKWEYEVDTFWFEKIRRGVRSYTPDFKITEPFGSVYYIEVKGWMDDKSKTKLKRMKKYHPTVDLRLFDAKAYRELARKIGPALPGWE